MMPVFANDSNLSCQYDGETILYDELGSSVPRKVPGLLYADYVEAAWRVCGSDLADG